MKFFSIAAVAAAALFTTSAAHAAELIQNGTFNTDTAGWVNTSPGTCGYNHSTNALPGVTGGHVRADALGPGICGFYQDVAIPAGANATLTASVGTAANGPLNTDAGRLEIRDPGTNAVLATLYAHDGTVSAPDPVAMRGPYNLNAYAGQTIRVYFYTRHSSQGYVHAIDNVSVDAVAAPAVVPTMTEWAMILFGLALAGAAALHIQRRRQPV